MGHLCPQQQRAPNVPRPLPIKLKRPSRGRAPPQLKAPRFCFSGVPNNIHHNTPHTKRVQIERKLFDVQRVQGEVMGWGRKQFGRLHLEIHLQGVLVNKPPNMPTCRAQRGSILRDESPQQSNGDESAGGRGRNAARGDRPEEVNVHNRINHSGEDGNDTITETAGPFVVIKM